MNDIREIDLTRSLPPSLKKDETMITLANVIATELKKNIKYTGFVTIYTRIHELDENILDILAYDLHVDWYDYNYPVEAKRILIKDSVKVHKRLGTKFAVETALGSLHPNSYIEEWFEYGGKPYKFRVILEVTKSRVTASYSHIIKEVKFYKRLSSKLESIIYQATANILIGVEGRAFPYRVGSTGKYNCGTAPQKAIIGVISEIESKLELKSFLYKTPATGTIPQKAITSQTGVGGIISMTNAEKYAYKMKRCGTSVCK